MTAKNRADNKAAFENGDKPQGTDFSNLVDSFVSLADSTAQSMTSKLETPELAGTAVSAGTLTVSSTITYTGPTTVAATASGASTLPASAAGYLTVQVSGRTAAIPFFWV